MSQLNGYQRRLLIISWRKWHSLHVSQPLSPATSVLAQWAYKVNGIVAWVQALHRLNNMDFFLLRLSWWTLLPTVMCGIQLASKYVKRCSTSFVIRELKMKIAIRYHYTSIKMARIPKLAIWNTDDNMQQQELSFIAGRNANYSPLWKTVLQFIARLSIVLS